MYEQPKYLEGKEYYTIDSCNSSKYLVKPIISTLHEFNRLNHLYLLFATRELAQHAADKKNAELKLLRLAREREKEFPISWHDEKQFKYWFNYWWCHEYGARIKCDFSTSNEEIHGAYFIFKDTIEGKDFLYSNFTPSEIESLCRPVRYV